jgi:hypothetical protein
MATRPYTINPPATTRVPIRASRTWNRWERARRNVDQALLPAERQELIGAVRIADASP